jgi:S-DNA-T family DNA segregation ATPase FtsK/SpoIIIE
MEHPTPAPILVASAGPDCGRPLVDLRTTTRPLVLGRSPRSDIHLADPAAEPHHLVITPSGDCSALAGSARRTAVGSVAIGSSLIGWSPAGVERTGSIVNRPPRLLPTAEPVTPSIDPGDTDRAHSSVPVATGLGPAGPIAAVTGVIAAGIIAAITRNAMFVLFALVGVVTSLSVTGVELVRIRRARRSRLVEDDRRRDRIAAAITVSVAAIVEADRDRWPLDLIGRAHSPRVWERRLTHLDATRVVIGVADRPAPLDLSSIAVADRPPATSGLTVIPERPVTIDLAPGTVCIVTAADARSVAVADGLVRSLVGQLMVQLGPADLVLVDQSEIDTVTDDSDGSSSDPNGPHTVVVLEDTSTLVDVTSPIRRLLASPRPPAVIAVAGPGANVPSTATTIIEVDHRSAGRLREDPVTGASPVTVAVAGITAATLASVRAVLAPLLDPERPPSDSASIPSSVTLGTILADGDDDPAPGDRSRVEVVLGIGAEGVVDIDLVAHGPHMLVAGTTGSGKSELLASLAVSIALRHRPDDVQMLLVDHKGGAGLGHLARLPHVVGVVTDLDGDLVDRTLVGLEAEIRRRECALARLGARDLASAGRTGTDDDGRGVPARLIVIVDELAALLVDRHEAARTLTDIARRGRSLGVHLVLATQRPTGVVPEALAANVDLRVALRVRDAADSVDVIGDPSAARIPRGLPGRAVVRIGGDAPRSVQTALTATDDIDRSIDRWSSSSGEVVAWYPPLPDLLVVGPDDPGHHHGLVDRPDRQEQPPLTWDPDDGSLAVIGPVGSGTTTALVTLTVRHCDTQVFVLDGRGDRRLDDLASREHVAPVVRVDDVERVGRLLRHLCTEIDARRRVGGSDALGRIVLAVDGFDEVRRVVDELPGRAGDLLDRVLVEGPAVGIVAVVATSGTIPLRHRMTEWVLVGRPGRIHLTAADGARAVAQIAVAAAESAPPVGRCAPAPTPIGALPELVDPVASPAVGRRRHDGVELTIGIDAATLRPHVLTVPDGEHLLVLGPARSGRTSTLEALVGAWSDAHRELGGLVTRVSGDLGDVPVLAGPHLVVVDDAARLDDPTGAFSARLDAGEAGLTVFAAGHADALRARFGHWTQVVRRSRRGLVMSASADGDGDLLGLSLPTRPMIAARPGLAWWIADGVSGQIQVVAPSPVPSRLR